MTYRVWAPVAHDSVELVLTDRRVPLQPNDDGWWEHDGDLTPGTTYTLSVDGGLEVPDPRALRLPDGPHGPAQVFDPTAFTWTDQDWRGSKLAGAVIYELHLGTFTAEGTLDAAQAKLPYLAELGVTHVELMPVATFPGVAGWGYDGVGLFAVHEPYGGPEALQRFVDAAHGHGLAVGLDVVYNHLGPDGNYLSFFGPYFSGRHHTPWGQAVNLDGPNSDPVRAFLIDNATMWLRDFHVDLLRLDAVHALIDESAVHILEDLARAADAVAESTGIPRELVAEDDRNDPRTTTPRGAGHQIGGLGISGQWTDDIHHALHVALTGETQGYYEDFASPEALAKVLTGAFFHDGTWSTFRHRRHGRPVDRATVPGHRFVASLQTHDQVGNRATGDRLAATVDEGRLAAGAALLLTSPFTPMLFMGEEFAASTPWQYFTDHTDEELAESIRRGRRAEFASHGWRAEDIPDPQSPGTVEASRLDWSEVDQGGHARVLAWYRALIALRRNEADLRDDRLDQVHVDWDDHSRLAVMTRGRLRTIANLGDTAATVEASGAQLMAAWDDTVQVNQSSVTVPARSAAVVRVGR